jgi:arginyl-tRNA synthetase
MGRWAMSDTKAAVTSRLQVAFDHIERGADPVLRPSDRADYQANGVLPLAKRLGRSPVGLAEEVVAGAQLDDICEAVEISGPGFINLTLSTPYLIRQLSAMVNDHRLGVPVAGQLETVVVDYSAPNIAKEMHVGHLRTTVIGDSLCRLLEFRGHRVVRENHVGDWGTPFGMLIEHLIDLGEETGVHELSVGDLDAFYQAARRSFDADEAFRTRSRARVVLLQSGEEETLRLWHLLVDESVRYFDEVYDRLGVLLMDSDIVGESFYNPMLSAVVEDLKLKSLLQESDGAACVFPPGFVNREGEPLPLIVQKSDEGFGYAATDLAAIRDRVDRIGATRILYVVGAPQAQHFQMVFATARLAGWLPDDVTAEHVAFGNVLGQDHKMLKSRSGDPLKLVDLLDEAVDRAGAVLADRASDMDAAQRATVAGFVGIGAVKYSDLATDRTRDYVFDWDRMLTFDGNTGPYIQYAHARIRSILRRADTDPGRGESSLIIGGVQERELALRLLAFGEAVESAVDLSSPSKLCAYLFDLASTFTSFYENCPVLNAPDSLTRSSRLLFCELTAGVLSRGLDLLGIVALDQM